VIRFLRYFILVIQISSIIFAQQIDKVLVSGFGGQHDLDVKTAFMIGYASYNSTPFTGEIILYSYSLEASFEYAEANGYDVIIRSTTALPTGLYLAPNYPSVELVMPAGSNSYIHKFSGDVIGSPVVITGAGVDSNQTAYELEFYSIDPITANSYSSFSNGYIAGQLAFIANTLNCSFDSARVLARDNGSENGDWDFYNGFGEIQTTDIIAGALPVELTSFTSEIIGGNIYLRWQTATEVNNYGFEVQKSEVGSKESEWIDIGFVEGNGNSNSIKEYSFIDREFNSGGTYYYRLKQIDNDGTYEYSQVIEVDFNILANMELLQNYPNPFNPSTTITFSLSVSEFVTLKIFNIMGEEVRVLVDENLASGNHQVEFDARGLASGIYIYQLSSDSFILSKKMQYLK
jgi:hypothetical protein